MADERMRETAKGISCFFSPHVAFKRRLGLQFSQETSVRHLPQTALSGEALPAMTFLAQMRTEQAESDKTPRVKATNRNI